MINKRDCRLLSNYRIERESKYNDRNSARDIPYISCMLSVLSAKRTKQLI